MITIYFARDLAQKILFQQSKAAENGLQKLLMILVGKYNGNKDISDKTNQKILPAQATFWPFTALSTAAETLKQNGMSGTTTQLRYVCLDFGKRATRTQTSLLIKSKGYLL